MPSTYYLNPTLTLELTNSPSSAKHQYLLSTGKRHYYVDAIVGDIVARLQSNQNSDKIFEEISQKFNITREAFDELLAVKLPAMGVLITSLAERQSEQTPSGPESITFLFHLMPRLLTAQLASRAARMFSKPAVVATLVLMLAILTSALIMGDFTYLNLQRLVNAPTSFTAQQFGELYLLIFMAAVIHELGHLAAAKYFNCEVDRINVGVYLIFPVFYVDMSNTWKLSASQRIVVNLGGIYFQFIFTVGLLLFAQFRSSQLVMYSFYVSLYIILANLNPFLKFDGYWVYGDYFKIINLRKQHLQLLGSFMRASPSNWIAMFSAAWKANAGLAAYVVGATAFLTYFSYLLIKLLMEFLILFPNKLMALINSMSHSATIWMGLDVFLHISYQFFLIFAFAMISRRLMLFVVSAWRHGRAEASAK